MTLESNHGRGLLCAVAGRDVVGRFGITERQGQFGKIGAIGQG